MWLIRGRAAGQGMVFGLFVLNKVYNFYVSVLNRDLKWRVSSYTG